MASPFLPKQSLRVERPLPWALGQESGHHMEQVFSQTEFTFEAPWVVILGAGILFAAQWWVLKRQKKVIPKYVPIAYALAVTASVVYSGYRFHQVTSAADSLPLQVLEGEVQVTSFSANTKVDIQGQSLLVSRSALYCFSQPNLVHGGDFMRIHFYSLNGQQSGYFTDPCIVKVERGVKGS